MRIVVVSATSVIAQSCIHVWATAGSHEFILVGRSEERLSAIKADLSIRYPKSNFKTSKVDLDSPTDLTKLLNALGKKAIDLVLVAQGSLTNQQKASQDLVHLHSELSLNAVSVAVVAEGFAGILEKQGFGTLGVVGSVAGDRGRAYNYSYGSSKALIETYTQGLQQRFAKTEVSVCLIKPGPTATPMTLSHPGKKATPMAVAKVIVAGLKGKRRVIYAPGLWRTIMFVVRLIPFSIFKYLKF